jgi:hypothetical protein
VAPVIRGGVVEWTNHFHEPKYNTGGAQLPKV